MTPITFPDAAGAFTLTPAQAAEVLDMSETELLDLTRAGFAFALTVPPHLVSHRPPVMYAPGLLPAMRDLLESHDTTARAAETRTVAIALRDYLSKRPPVELHGAAQHNQAALLARNNSGDVLAHIQLHVLASWVQRVAPLGGPGAFAHLRSHMIDALTQLGCERVKGIRALGDRKQNWRVWWRVPRSMWAPDGATPDIADWPAFAQPSEPMAAARDDLS